MTRNGLTGLHPLYAIEGGRLTLHVTDVTVTPEHVPQVHIGATVVSPVFASSREVKIVVPAGLEGGQTPVRLDDEPGSTVYAQVGVPVATGLHQVDSPVIDRDGNLYVTYSGSRGQQTGVSIYRVRPGGARELFVSGVTNPTSLAFDRDGRLYVSSRFDGTVSRVDEHGAAQVIASDLGVACGIAFDHDGAMYVGDRSGTIFRIGPSGGTTAFASLPPSVAAFHLAYGGSEGWLYATAPTLSPRDAVYRIDRHGRIETLYAGFGRPQGLAVDPRGDLYVAEALAGSSGIYRVRHGVEPELIVSGPSLIGIAFDPRGGFAVTTADTAYRFH
jgi:Strictosidine synthase-like, N-terminal